MAYENILVEAVDGGVGLVTLNRPQVLNALSYDLVSELDEAVTAFEADPTIRCVVITGAGEKAFSAGADIHEMADFTPEQMEERRKRRSEFTWHLANLKLPTIGALNGLTYGGAAVLASSLDIRIGCERTRFRFLAAAYGRLNSTWSLPMLVGWGIAKELLFSARVVEAEEAARIGLLNRVVTGETLLEEALALGRQIAANTPDSVQGIKQIMHEDVGLTWRGMYDNEADAVTHRFRPPTVREGFAEFLSRKGRK